MEKTVRSEVAECFSREFATCFGDVVTEAVGEIVKLSTQGTFELSRQESETVHYRISIGGVNGGHCFIEMSKPDVLSIASRIVRDDSTEYGLHHAEAVQQTVEAAVRKVKAKLAAAFQDLDMTVDAVSDLVFGGMQVIRLTGSGFGTEFPVLLYFSSGFDEAISGRGSDLMSSAFSSTHASARNLDLIMDVELNVTLRFGQRQMPLREVLELESGSVIELDRKVDAPVELLLDGKVIAWGEAVIVDGNYGIRITRVPQPITSHWN